MLNMLLRFGIGIALRHGGTFIAGVLTSGAVAHVLGNNAIGHDDALAIGGAVMGLVATIASAAHNRPTAVVGRATDIILQQPQLSPAPAVTEAIRNNTVPPY